MVQAVNPGPLPGVPAVPSGGTHIQINVSDAEIDEAVDESIDESVAQAIDGAVVRYFDTHQVDISGLVIPDASDTVKGIVKLAGDLTGTADVPTIVEPLVNLTVLFENALA